VLQALQLAIEAAVDIATHSIVRGRLGDFDRYLAALEKLLVRRTFLGLSASGGRTSAMR
jgi:hypothetical protein